jgi:hypothetical protein
MGWWWLVINPKKVGLDAAELLMEKLNWPRTRENYLACLFLGDVPKGIDPEIELTQIPEEFQINPPEEIE